MTTSSYVLYRVHPLSFRTMHGCVCAHPDAETSMLDRLLSRDVTRYLDNSDVKRLSYVSRYTHSELSWLWLPSYESECAQSFDSLAFFDSE